MHAITARALLRTAFVFWIACCFMSAACQGQTLVIAKQREPSALGEIAQKVVERAFEQAGLQISYRPLPLPRAIEVANDGEADGDLMRILDVTKRYSNLVAVPTPLVENQLAIYGLDQSLVTMSRQQVANLKFGYVRGTFIVTKHTQGLRTTETRSMESAFDMLNERRFDVIVSTYLDSRPSIASHAMSMYVWPHAWAAEPLHLLLHKRNMALVPKIDSALQAMKNSGEIDRIYVEKLKELGIAPLPRAEK